MRYLFCSALIFIVACVTVFGDLEGQGRPGFRGPQSATLAFGARAGWDSDEDVMSVGGHVRIGLQSLPGLLLAPSADVYLFDGSSQWQANLDVALQLFPFIYGGGGLAIARDSLPTATGTSLQTGYNYFLGLSVPPYDFPIKPFAEVRWTAINRFVNPRRLVFGINVVLLGDT